MFPINRIKMERAQKIMAGTNYCTRKSAKCKTQNIIKYQMIFTFKFFTVSLFCSLFCSGVCNEKIKHVYHLPCINLYLMTLTSLGFWLNLFYGTIIFSRQNAAWSLKHGKQETGNHFGENWVNMMKQNKSTNEEKKTKMAYDVTYGNCLVRILTWAENVHSWNMHSTKTRSTVTYSSSNLVRTPSIESWFIRDEN